MNFPPNKHQPVVNPETSIVFDGELWDVGVRVVKWYDEGGYNAYATNKVVIRDEDRKTGRNKKVKVIRGKRYGGRIPMPGRKVGSIYQFMLHHTGGYLPGVCFETLHNQRKLSVQFIQADDGTIYQTLDAKEIAWHGGKQNRPSIGVECCLYPNAADNPEAYREAKCKRLGLTPHTIGNVYTQGKVRSVFEMPPVQIECLAFLVAGVWFARNKIAGLEDAPPKFPREVISGQRPRITSDFNKSHRKHEGLILHANASPHKWDATGLLPLEFEKKVGVIYQHLKEGVMPERGIV